MKKSKKRIVINVIEIIFILGVMGVMFMLYGPISWVRNTLIT